MNSEDFRAAMRRAGLDYSGPIHADSKLHRIKVEGDKARNSWYVLHPGPPMGGAFGCWKRGLNEKWCDHFGNLSQPEWREVHRRWQEAERERERTETELQAKACKIAAWIVEHSCDVVSHPYLARKAIKPCGEIRAYHGVLVIPLRDAAGQLHNLQFIGANGEKKFLTGGRIASCFFTLGDKSDGPLLIVEGYATGTSVHEATGFATVCAMNCGNLLAVAKALRIKFPQREIILAADNDQWTEKPKKNPGVSASTTAAKAIGAKLAVPQFKDITTKPTDFNDLHQLEGVSTVKNQIESATEPESNLPPGATDLKAELLNNFDTATCSAEMLAKVVVPPRELVLGDWFKQGDLGFIYGARGLGKTWLGLHIARQCAEGGKVGDRKVHKPRRVLYVDGEMALDEIRKRDAALSTAPADGMLYLHHEVLFHGTGRVLNLTNPSAQAALLDKCKRDKIEILLLDNLSCLFTGIKENDADAWEQVLPWLLELRRNRIAVVFIAHAGRNGFMRGTSRREDAAFWIIQLTEATDASEVQTGARFVTRFVKNRNTTESGCPPLEWRIDLPKGESRAIVHLKPMSTTQMFRQCIEDGLTGASDIAEELGISKGQVSKLAKKGIVAGWLKKERRDYVLTGKT